MQVYVSSKTNPTEMYVYISLASNYSFKLRWVYFDSAPLLFLNCLRFYGNITCTLPLISRFMGSSLCLNSPHIPAKSPT